MKKEIPLDELVESHKPKNVKYKYLFKDNETMQTLLDMKYSISTLDTINNDDLVNAALDTEYISHERTIVGKAKEPSIMDNGIIISKKLVTKADKKLLNVGLGFFTFNNTRYLGIKLQYEKFDIIEIFCLI